MIIKLTKRKVRTVGALPTHHDANPWVEPQPAPTKQERAASAIDRLLARADLALADLTADGGLLPREYVEQFSRRIAESFRLPEGWANGGTVTGRMVSRGPNPQYDLRPRGESHFSGLLDDINFLPREIENYAVQDSVQAYRLARAATFGARRGGSMQQALYAGGMPHLHIPAPSADEFADLARDVNVRSRERSETSTFYGMPVIETPAMPPNRVLIARNSFRRDPDSGAVWMDTEASFDPTWLDRLYIDGRIVMGVDFGRVEGAVAYQLYTRAQPDLRPYNDPDLILPGAHLSVHNDDKQSMAPHARFLAENQRFATRRKRRL